MNLGDLMNLIPFNEKLVITYYKNGEIMDLLIILKKVCQNSLQIKNYVL